MIDQLDRRILHALQIDGRAPFRRIATVLGVSEQTVARRYRRLRAGELVRVSGMIDPRRLRRTDWLVRVQCRPDSARALAEAVARHEQSTWVSLTAGGAEIVCTARASLRPGSNQVLLDRLPRTAQVMALNAYSVLHRFDEGGRHWSGYADELDARQIAELTPPVPAGAEIGLQPDDDALVDALARDGRANYTDLAAATGWPAARVTQRIAELHASGVLYFDVEFSPRLMGFDTMAYLWLTVSPGALGSTGSALALHRETAWVAAVTGTANLVAMVVCRDPEALYQYVNERIGSFDSVRAVEISPQLHSVKQAGSLVNGDRLTETTPVAAAHRVTPPAMRGRRRKSS